MSSRRRFLSVLAFVASACDCGSPAELPDAGATPDGGMPGPSDGGADAAIAIDGGFDAGAPIPIPRPIAPLTTERVATLRPLLRATALAGFRVELELCADRACGSILASGDLEPDGTYRVGEALAPGVKFWRVRAREDVELGRTGEWSATWSFRVPHGSPAIDSATGLALDANGDGLADLIETNRSHAAFGTHIEYGRADPTVPLPVFPWEAWRTRTLRRPVSALGDVNGDGFVDVAISDSPRPTAITQDIYFGSEDGLRDDPDQMLEVTEAAFAIARAAGTDIGGFSGWAAWGGAMHPLGDVNRDGYADVAVAFETPEIAPWALVYWGSAAGLEPDPRAAFGPIGIGPDTVAFSFACTLDHDGDGLPEFAPVPDWHGRAIRWYELSPAGIEAGSIPIEELTDGGMPLGPRILGCGDFNGDGYGDLSVGVEYYYDLGRGHRIYTTYGSATGFGDLVAFELAREDSRTALGTLSSVGDVDGDGFDDLLVSVESIPGIPTRPFLFFGSATGFGTSPRSLVLDAPTTMGLVIDTVSHADIDGDAREDFVFSTITAAWDPPVPLPFVGLWLSSHGLESPARRTTSTIMAAVYLGQ